MLLAAVLTSPNWTHPKTVFSHLASSYQIFETNLWVVVILCSIGDAGKLQKWGLNQFGVWDGEISWHLNLQTSVSYDAFPVRPSAYHLLVRIFTLRRFGCSWLCMGHNYSILLTSKILGNKNEFSSNTLPSSRLTKVEDQWNPPFVHDFPGETMGLPWVFYIHRACNTTATSMRLVDPAESVPSDSWPGRERPLELW